MAAFGLLLAPVQTAMAVREGSDRAQDVIGRRSPNALVSERLFIPVWTVVPEIDCLATQK
jgi:hypothetical protein